MKKSLIFANGTLDEGWMVSHAIEEADSALLIAADGGARIAQHLGLQPDVIIGDMDSLTEEELHLIAQHAAIHRFPPEKDETDLELALLHAIEHGASWIRIIGALGGRFDQTLANVYLLTLPQFMERDVAIVSGDQMVRVLHPGNHTIIGEIGDTLSLIPLSTEVAGISSKYLKYPLKNESLYLGPTRGVSNVMEAIRAEISYEQGILLLVHTKGQA